MTVGSFTNAPVDNREAESISHQVEKPKHALTESYKEYN